ncbi:MAG: sigma-70 family RNA polymerase sigma factor [Ruminococcus sp.]|nr:sigma-70 family RNA polymerase sigma factor [Ruminococcus sp.]
MKIFYIEDDNGEFISINGKKRFTRLIGKKAIDFLNSKNGKKRFFLKTESNEYDVLNFFVDEIFIEVPSEKVSEIRSEKNHEDYLDKCEEETGYKTVSFEDLPHDDGIISGEELIDSGNENIEDTAIYNMNIECLHKALQALSQEEFAIIQCMYLSKNPMTERQLASVLEISQQAVHKRKESILKKLKKNLKI